ncbi:MAG: NAD(+) synthase [Clostridia bacterium]|nr:NAD(+) synthase [Clostridia bacterium]
MKIVTSVFVVSLGYPKENAKKMTEIMEHNEGDIYLFPAYSLTGSSAGELYEFPEFKTQTEAALDSLCEFSEKTGKIIVTSVPYHENVIIKDGILAGKSHFELEGKTVAVSENGNEDDFDVLLLPTIMPGYPCIQNDIIEYCMRASGAKNCVVAVANGGFGESSADNVYKGFCGVFNKGITVSFTSQDAPETIVATADHTKDTGLIYTRQKVADYKIPYYGKNDKKRYLEELFSLQTQALYMRLVNTGIKKAVINVSGGLDSTMALLVAENTFKMLGYPVSDITALTLPCFSTSSRTNKNAKKLMELLGVNAKEINIKDSILQHFKDIGHDAETADVTYENAQARERAQILFDVANQQNALALGTGDLSEAALGFATYAGDTLCHYNVNATVPKTVMRELVAHIAKKRGGELEKTLLDIVDTPVSPELKDGQKTEDILGPYILHDFIIYYFAKHKFPRSEIQKYMLATFDEYDDDTINAALDTFYSRYYKNQFKRSSACEGANLIGFTLPYMPADMKPLA